MVLGESIIALWRKMKATGLTDGTEILCVPQSLETLFPGGTISIAGHEMAVRVCEDIVSETLADGTIITTIHFLSEDVLQETIKSKRCSVFLYLLKKVKAVVRNIKCFAG